MIVFLVRVRKMKTVGAKMSQSCTPVMLYNLYLLLLCSFQCSYYDECKQSLALAISIETQHRKLGFTNWVKQFCRYQYFCKKYYFKS